MPFENLLLERAHGVATVTLNRPERLNALTTELLTELRSAAQEIAADQSIRVAVLTGAGRGFCAGADLAAHGSPKDASLAPGTRSRNRLQQFFNPAAQAWYELQIPVIAAVNGVAAGAGVSLALAADVVIAARSATFLQVFAPKLGLVPDMGATFHVPRLVGIARAKGLALFGDKLTAEQAAQWGLIWECVDDVNLASTVQRYALALSTGPTRAFAAVKRIYNDSSALQRAMSEEAMTQGELAESADFAEGVAAFLAKRPANFIGK